MNFKIYEIDEENKTMIIDWGDGQQFNYRIPQRLLDNDDLTQEQIAAEIEKFRPSTLAASVPDEEDRPLHKKFREFLATPPAGEIKENRPLEDALTFKAKYKYMNYFVFTLPAGSTQVVNTPNTKLQRTTSYSYITQGQVDIMNDNLPEPIPCYPSDQQVVGGLAYPGENKLIANQDSVYKCVTFKDGLEPYNIHELKLGKYETAKITERWEQALVIRGFVESKSTTIYENNFFAPRQGTELAAGEKGALVIFASVKKG